MSEGFFQWVYKQTCCSTDKCTRQICNNGRVRAQRQPHWNGLAELKRQITVPCSKNRCSNADVSFRGVLQSYIDGDWPHFPSSTRASRNQSHQIPHPQHTVKGLSFLFDLTMQLFNSILVPVIFLSTTALALKSKYCANVPKSFNSLRASFSFEVLFRYDTLESTTPGKRPVIRIFTENERKWDVPEIGRPENGSTVFQLKNNILYLAAGRVQPRRLRIRRKEDWVLLCLIPPCPSLHMWMWRRLKTAMMRETFIER